MDVQKQSSRLGPLGLQGLGRPLGFRGPGVLGFPTFFQRWEQILGLRSLSTLKVGKKLEKLEKRWKFQLFPTLGATPSVRVISYT